MDESHENIGVMVYANTYRQAMRYLLEAGVAQLYPVSDATTATMPKAAAMKRPTAAKAASVLSVEAECFQATGHNFDEAVYTGCDTDFPHNVLKQLKSARHELVKEFLFILEVDRDAAVGQEVNDAVRKMFMKVITQLFGDNMYSVSLMLFIPC